MSKIYRTELRIENGTHEWHTSEYEVTQKDDYLYVHKGSVRQRIIMREIIDFVFVRNKDFGSATFECWHLDKDAAAPRIMTEFDTWKKYALQICNEIHSSIASVTAEWENIKSPNQSQS